MGLKLCFVIGTLPATARPLAQAVPALLEAWRTDFFVPFVVAASPHGAAEVGVGSPHVNAMWPGERPADASRITAVEPERGVTPREIGHVLEAAQGDVWLRMNGALRFHVEGRSTIDWHGHWDTGSSLHELVTMIFEWSATGGTIELTFPMSGYPLTRTRPTGRGTLEYGDPLVAAENRETLGRALRAVAPAFSVSTSSIAWTTDGDYAGLFAADGAALLTLVESLASDQVENDDIVFLRSTLAAGAVEDRALTLRNLMAEPSKDPRVIRAITGLLDDQAACLVSIPPRFGEIRFLAATALASERRAIGDRSPVEIACIPPVSTTDLMAAMDGENLQWPAGDPVAAALSAFEELRTLGVLRDQVVRFA